MKNFTCVCIILFCGDFNRLADLNFPLHYNDVGQRLETGERR